jgi:hypothetical protein
MQPVLIFEVGQGLRGKLKAWSGHCGPPLKKGEVVTQCESCTADASGEVRFRTTNMATLEIVGFNEGIRGMA